MCYEHGKQDCCHHGGSHHSGPCACGGSDDFGPCFWTNKEKIAYLEESRENLQNKLKSVEGRIAALKEEE